MWNGPRWIRIMTRSCEITSFHNFFYIVTYNIDTVSRGTNVQSGLFTHICEIKKVPIAVIQCARWCFSNHICKNGEACPISLPETLRIFDVSRNGNLLPQLPELVFMTNVTLDRVVAVRTGIADITKPFYCRYTPLVREVDIRDNGFIFAHQDLFAKCDWSSILRFKLGGNALNHLLNTQGDRPFFKPLTGLQVRHYTLKIYMMAWRLFGIRRSATFITSMVCVCQSFIFSVNVVVLKFACHQDINHFHNDQSLSIAVIDCVRCWCAGVRLNVKMSSYQYRDPHIKDKTVSRPSYL